MMSHPHEGPMSEGRESGFDALVELGSVPVHLLHGINDLFGRLNQSIRESAPRQSKRAMVMSILAVGAFLLAACSDGHPIPEDIRLAMVRTQYLQQQESERMQATAQAQQQERQAQEAQAQAQAEATAQMQYEQMLAEPEKYHPDWYQLMTVTSEDNLGVLAALERATGQTPYKIEGLAGGQIQMFIIVSEINGNRVYDWEHLLRENPRIDPGDRILHTVMTPSEFSKFARQQGIPEENVFMVR